VLNIKAKAVTHRSPDTQGAYQKTICPNHFVIRHFSPSQMQSFLLQKNFINFQNFSSIKKGLIAARIMSLTVFLTLLLSSATISSPSTESVQPQWKPFAEDTVDGLAYFAGRVTHPGIDFHALRIDLANAELQIVVAAGGGDADTVLSTKISSFVRTNDLLAGINALPFSPVSGKEGEERTNLGIVVADRVMISPPSPGYDALVLYADRRAAIVAQSDIASVESEGIENAVGGFQRILEGGELVQRVLDVNVRHPRSAAGISSDGRFLYLLVIDGRRLGSIGATEAETAVVLRALGASEGINFDGGGSSALVLRQPNGKVRAVNIPIHDFILGRERAVAGCLGVKAHF
jgi:hypothetical protein